MPSLRTPPNLAPPDLLRDATTLDLLTFMACYGDAPLLLVRLPEGDTELELGLAATASSTGRTTVAKPLPFRTTHQASPTHSRRSEDARRGAREPLERLLGKHAHFAVPLRKREGSDTVMGHISVGRAQNKDIVLRHSSVSKFHAWFEEDPSEEDFYVSDAGSTNLSQVNGQRLEPRIRTSVGPGDVVRFGAVETVLCTSEALWFCMNPDKARESSER